MRCFSQFRWYSSAAVLILVSPIADQGRVTLTAATGTQEAVTTLQVPPPPEHTPGVEFTLEEVSRAENNGSTVVNYQPALAGLPQGKAYELWMGLSFLDPVPVPLPMTLPADASGRLVVPVGFEANRYHKGEPYELQLRSSDQTVQAFVKVFPFPITAVQDACRVWVEFMRDNFREVAIWGDGFAPGEAITLTTNDGRDDREHQLTVSAGGMFSQRIDHRNQSGMATLSAMTSACTVRLSYDYGSDAEEVQ